MQLADERQPGAVPAAEAGDLVAAVPGVPGENEAATGQADHQQPQEPAHELGRGAVDPAAGLVGGLVPIQVDEYGQRPGAGGEGELDQNR